MTDSWLLLCVGVNLPFSVVIVFQRNVTVK